MADQQTADLPEGTDKVIEAPNIGAIATKPTGRDDSDDGTISIARYRASAVRAAALQSASAAGARQIASQAGDKARGFVTQGLERTSEALANVAKMVGDTADGIEERLGPDYGDYARRAAGAIENVANTIAEKDPDELIEDTRTFVRNSPGVALAGAAVVGFVVARLVKSGLGRNDGDDATDAQAA